MYFRWISFMEELLSFCITELEETSKTCGGPEARDGAKIFLHVSDVSLAFQPLIHDKGGEFVVKESSSSMKPLQNKSLSLVSLEACWKANSLTYLLRLLICFSFS